MGRAAPPKRRGGRCPRCGNPPALCTCGSADARGSAPVRVATEVRGEETLTTVFRVPLSEAELRGLSGELGRACGSESALSGRTIEIRGDHRRVVAKALEGRGYSVVVS